MRPFFVVSGFSRTASSAFKRTAWLGVLTLFVVMVTAADSHHAFSPVYDGKKTIEVEGVVTQFRFVNPHAMMLMDVTDKKTGKLEKWNVEFAGRLNLEEAGWTADSIKAGEHVKVTGNPTWTGSQRMAFVKLVRADGTTLEPGRAQRLSAIEEERRQRAKQREQQPQQQK
jgi:uncharacterized protein DUF6152